VASAKKATGSDKPSDKKSVIVSLFTVLLSLPALLGA